MYICVMSGSRVCLVFQSFWGGFCHFASTGGLPATQGNTQGNTQPSWITSCVESALCFNLCLTLIPD